MEDKSNFKFRFNIDRGGTFTDIYIVNILNLIMWDAQLKKKF